MLSSKYNELGAVTGLATFSGGGTQLATAQIPLSLATHDTFFGFIAPADQWITSLNVSAYKNGQSIYFMRFDDLGFVTKSFIPEPTPWLLAVFGSAMLGRRRAMSVRDRQA
ncbi:MAG: hypothetical protein C0485_01510 [Pirellula sp.]|nr:hypothetical protein [Pirellula sp.]